MNSCSTKVQFDELWKIMRNQNMKHIAAKGINSAYGRAKDIVLFGEDKTSKKRFPVIGLHTKRYLKSNQLSKNQCYFVIQ